MKKSQCSTTTPFIDALYELIHAFQSTCPAFLPKRRVKIMMSIRFERAIMREMTLLPIKDQSMIDGKLTTFMGYAVERGYEDSMIIFDEENPQVMKRIDLQNPSG